MIPPRDPLLPSLPPERNGGCTGCLMALGVMVAGIFGMIPILGLMGGNPLVVAAGMPVVVGLSGYMLFFPTARRRRWIRRRRLTRLFEKLRLADARFTRESVSLPLSAFSAGSASTPIDDPRHQTVRASIARARNEWGLVLDASGDRLCVHAAALPVKAAYLKAEVETLSGLARWLADAPDPIAAWCTALVTGAQQDPAVVRSALARLVEHAPEAPATRRVVEQALAHSDPRFRLAAGLAVHDQPTLEALLKPEFINGFEPIDVRALVDACRAAGDDAALLTHVHPAVRLAWLIGTPTPGADALLTLAGDSLAATRSIAWAVTERLAPDVMLEAARRVLQADDVPDEHPMTVYAEAQSVDARRDPIPRALDICGARGGPEDIRLVAPLLEHPRHGRSARRARARMHVRLADRLDAGQLSIPTTTAGGELSVEPNAEGRLSVPSDAIGKP